MRRCRDSASSGPRRRPRDPQRRDPGAFRHPSAHAENPTGPIPSHPTKRLKAPAHQPLADSSPSTEVVDQAPPARQAARPATEIAERGRRSNPSAFETRWTGARRPKRPSENVRWSIPSETIQEARRALARRAIVRAGRATPRTRVGRATRRTWDSRSLISLRRHGGSGRARRPGWVPRPRRCRRAPGPRRGPDSGRYAAHPRRRQLLPS
jgi:hypothetical protein